MPLMTMNTSILTVPPTPPVNSTSFELTTAPLVVLTARRSTVKVAVAHFGDTAQTNRVIHTLVKNRLKDRLAMLSPSAGDSGRDFLRLSLCREGHNCESGEVTGRRKKKAESVVVRRTP